jgi:hypothetical protein
VKDRHDEQQDVNHEAIDSTSNNTDPDFDFLLEDENDSDFDFMLEDEDDTKDEDDTELQNRLQNRMFLDMMTTVNQRERGLPIRK